MTDKTELTDEWKKLDKWPQWWFVNGGHLHAAWKYRRYSQIRDSARDLPKLAWDKQQEKIDKLEEKLKAAEKLASKIIWHEENLGTTPTYILNIAQDFLAKLRS